MKQELKKQLIKDIVIAIVAWIISAIIMGAIAGDGFFVAILLGFACAGIPFGWKWLSSLFVALNLYTVVFKFILAVLLGFIALPVVIIKDIVAYCTAE